MRQEERHVQKLVWTGFVCIDGYANSSAKQHEELHRMFDGDGTNSRSQLYAQNADRTGPHDNKMVFAQRGATDGVGQLCHSQSECGAEAFPHKNNALIAVAAAST